MSSQYYDTPYGKVRIDNVEGIQVLRDDLYPGGTKARVIPELLETLGAPETVVYASPAPGYAQVALAYAAKATGRRAVIFTAARKEQHARTNEAERAGATIIQVPYGYLSNVTAKAETWAKENNALRLPFGIDIPEMRTGITKIAAALPEPTQVWTVAGSGTLTRSLQDAWSSAEFHAVRIGSEPKIGRASLHLAPERFEQMAKVTPPFPSCGNYDAKAWRFILDQATTGSLFWNVAA